MTTTDASDLLYGFKAIGKYLQISARQAQHRASEGGIPTFKMGHTVCSRRSTLDAWIAEREAAARKPIEREA